MKGNTYTARCQRSGDWWAISVPELRGVHTQARRLEKAEVMVRDATALFLDVPSVLFDVRIEPVLPRDLQGKVGRARKVRGEAEVLQRDAGRVLGLSHQRITQLLKAASGKGRRSHGRGTRVAGAG